MVPSTNNHAKMANLKRRILSILADAKALAQEYRLLAGKPLGIAREVAEIKAARLLKVKFAPPRHAREFDAVLLVLLAASLDAFCIYQADRDSFRSALTAPGTIVVKVA